MYTKYPKFLFTFDNINQNMSLIYLLYLKIIEVGTSGTASSEAEKKYV